MLPHLDADTDSLLPSDRQGKSVLGAIGVAVVCLVFLWMTN